MCRLRKNPFVPVWPRIVGIGILVLTALCAGSALAQPVNDYFTNATDLTFFDTGLGSGTNTDDNTGATLEPGEPTILTNSGGASVWYTWTAPTNGIVTFQTSGAAFQTLLAVYTGNNISNLNLIASDNASHAGNSQVTFVAVAGTTFDITVDGTNGAQGPFTLTWNTTFPVAAPSNDNFANAIVITNSSGTVFGDNINATLQYGFIPPPPIPPQREPRITGNNGGASIWYAWTAPSDGVVTFNTTGSTFDTLLGVYIGTNVLNLIPIAVNDDFMGRRTSQISFLVTGGTTYQIDIDGYNGSGFDTNAAMGFVVLNWNLAPLPLNDNFADATSLGSQTSGSISDSNLGATAEPNEPSHASFPAGSSLWYAWTAPQDGDVAVDTMGSSIDTVLAVYNGSTLSGLTQVAANDDLCTTIPFPGFGPRLPQQNLIAENLSTNIIPPGGVLDTNIPPIFNFTNAFLGNDFTIVQPFSGLPVTGSYGSGASGLHFNAKAGVTYHIAVDGKYGSAGPFQLNWAYRPSGVFRFASEVMDTTSGVPAKGQGSFIFTTTGTGNPGMLLYQVSETESDQRLSGTVNANQYNTTIHTGYGYNVPGLLVTITRVGGASGRVTVGYSTVDGNQLSDHYTFDTNFLSLVSDGVPITLNGDAPALGGRDYFPATGVLTFNDYEMSKTILIQIGDSVGNPQPNRDFGLVLFDPQVDTTETGDISQPRVDPIFSQALVRILDTDIDPRGPSCIPKTNTLSVTMTNNVTNVFTTNILVTNLFWTLIPTNPVFNFTKSYYRVPEDVTNYWGGTPITVYVNRSGTNRGNVTLHYRVNNDFLDKDSADQSDGVFPLQPGSDYAIPDPNVPVQAINQTFGGIIGGRRADFDCVASGTLTFPGGNNRNPQPITFTVYNTNLTQFNRDFHIDIFAEDSAQDNAPYQVGMVAEATVTILFPDEYAPAGSVDETYNPDFGLDLVEPVGPVGGIPLNQPGTDAQGQVNAVVVQPNNESIIAGAFSSYNGTSRNGIARVDINGLLDTSFDPGDGISIPTGDFITSLGLQKNGQVVVGGSFTSFNGTPCHSLVRLNADGSVDTAFLTASGGGANGIVRSLIVRDDGKIVIGGDFTIYNGISRRYVAQLNPDGSLDSSYDPGNGLNGPVYTISPQVAVPISVAADANGGQIEYTNIIAVGANSGVLTVTYDMFSIPDDMRVYYGDTNTAAGTGVLIFDTGLVNNTNTVVIPFGPTNGLTANTIEIVMNQGGGQNGTAWIFDASIQPEVNDLLTIGGDFTAAGGVFGQDHITRLLTNGVVDPSFDPGAGANGRVRSIITQTDGKVVLGGEFTMVNGQAANHIARLMANGTTDTEFFAGTGTDNTVYDLTYIPGTITNTGVLVGTNVVNQYTTNKDLIYLGGNFTVYNGTHRLGFARLNVDGSLDTSFLDTAYNQFAGLTRERFSDPPNAVFAAAAQSDGNVMVGGSFSQVGGGQFDPNVRPDSFDTFNQWPEPKSRDGVRNRSNVARLIGGSTAGPGNIGLLYNAYPATKSQGFDYISLLRTNGSLGYASANFSVLPGSAQSGLDYSYVGAAPLYPIEWDYIGPTRMHSDALFGTNTVMADIFGEGWSFGLNGPASTIVTINNNGLSSGNLNAQFQLANPVGADQFYLGGENIPVGVALGRSVAPLSIIDDNKKPGTFGFSSPTYVGVGSVPITVIRTNGNFNTAPILISYTTSPGSNTASGVDYVGTAGTLTFNNGDTSKAFNVQVIASNYISSIEKTVNLNLYNFPPGVPPGLTNAVLRIINPNFQGFLNFSATNYITNLTAGSIQMVVERNVGSLGTLDVQCITTNGTAIAGVDYVATTTNLHWNSGDVSPHIVTVPLINGGSVGPIKTFGAYLTNAALNGSSEPSLLGTITNTTLTISNDNSYGVFEFSAPSYVVNEATNGTATVTVIRTSSALSNATVSFTTADGTALAGVNYIATNGTLSFVQGQTAASFDVRIRNDGVTNVYPFYFNVLLTNASAGAFIGSPTNVPVNIVDAQSFNRPPGDGDVTFHQLGINGPVLSVALQTNGQIIAGGNFTIVDGVPRNHYVRLNPDGSLDTSFLNDLSGADASVAAVAVQSDGLALVGGAFQHIDGVARTRLARLQIDGSLDTSFNPGSGADNSIFAIAETFINGAREIYVGGAFTTFNLDGIPGIVRLNQDGSEDAAFATTGVIGTVNAIAVYPTNSVFAGKVLIAGSFNLVNGVNRTNIVRLNVDGSVDTNFNASADATIRAIAIQNDDGIVLGGDFANVNGNAATRLARLNSNGSFDSSFTANMGPGPNDAVDAIALQADNRIVIGGQFTSASGLPRNHIIRLLPTGVVDPTINFGSGANGVIDAIVVQPVDQMILIGGGFTTYNDEPAPYLTRIYGGSDTSSGAFEFTSAAYQVNENGVQAVITIRRTGGLYGPNPDGSGNVSVAFSTTPGSAIAGVNYNNVFTNVSFPPAYALETVLVPVIDDLVITSNKTVNLVLSNPSSPARLGNQTNAVLTILNTDNSVSFTSPVFQVAKNTLTGLANITLVRNGGGDQPCTVNFATTTNGTAVIGTDYFPTNVFVTFNPGVTQQVVQVGITNNNLPEGDRTVTMVLSNAVGSVLVSPSNAVLTIKDTTFSPGQLCFASSNFFASEADPNAIITVVRTNGTSGTISAFYYTVPGTAQPGVSYISVSNTITFSDGQTIGTFAVPMQQNSLVLGTVNFGVVLATNLTSGTTLTSPTNATVFIADDNSGFLFANATNTVRETTTPLAVQVLRVGPTNSTLSVNYATHDGTAVAGTNYTTTSGTLTFNPGETSKSIVVPIVNDPLPTGTLQFTLALSNPTPGSQLGYPATNYIEVLDADAGISFTNATMVVRRDVGNAVVTVITTNPAVEPPILNSNTVPMSVQYTTSDGTAVAGVDYIKTAGTLVFTNGNGTNVFVVPIINNFASGTRTFNVSLFNPTAPGRLVAPSNQVISIIDATAGFKFSSSRYSVNKTDGIATINVYRTGVTDSVASVNFQATNGSAIPNVQYFPTNGTLVFTNGVTNQTFDVQVIDTSTVQPNETVLLELFNPSNSVLGVPSASTLTIRDNTGSYVVPAGSQIISESGAGAPNGVVDSNETVTILFAFRDAGGLNVNNLIATLLATNGVTLPSPASQAYGPLIGSGHSVSEPFTFTAEGTNGQQIAATFQLQDGTTSIGTAVFGYVLGSLTHNYTNGAFIAINDADTATPYPSTISVSNLVGSVLKATITVTNVYHSSPGDIDALLVSPIAQDVLFMAHAGGQNLITNVTLTFDDTAGTMLPLNGQIISGTNKPSAYLPVPIFP